MEVKFSRQELYELVWKEPLLRLSKKYDISDVGLRKMCVRMDIPLPNAGHWQKLLFKKKSPVKPLSKEYNGEATVSLKIREGGQVTNNKRQQLKTLQKEIEQDSNLEIKVPDKLTNPDKLIIAARDHLTRKDRYLHDGLARCLGNNLISIKAAPENVGRALRFMDTLIKVLKARGHDVYVRSDSTYAFIEKEEIKISLRETLKREMVDDGRWKSAKYSPTGILAFKMERFPDKEWKDGKLKIEEQLPEIITRLEMEGQELRERTLRWEKQRAEDDERKRIARELEERQENELVAFKAILKDANRLHQAEVLRNYVDKVEILSIERNTLTDELKSWITWARQKADWYDPLVKSEDELLSRVDKETLTLKKKEWWER